MAFDYAPLAATADRLLAAFGQASIVRSRTGGTYDPVTGLVSGELTVNTSVNAVLVEFGSHYPFGSIVKGNVQQLGAISGDKLALLDGAIAVGDELIHDGEAWMCVETFHVKPGDTSMLYKAQMRGGSGAQDTNYWLVDGGVFVVDGGIQVVDTS